MQSTEGELGLGLGLVTLGGFPPVPSAHQPKLGATQGVVLPQLTQVTKD